MTPNLKNKKKFFLKDHKINNFPGIFILRFSKKNLLHKFSTQPKMFQHLYRSNRKISFLQTFTVHCTAAFLFLFLTHFYVRPKNNSKNFSFLILSSASHTSFLPPLLIRVDAASAVNIRDLMEWEWWDVYTCVRERGFWCGDLKEKRV